MNENNTSTYWNVNKKGGKYTIKEVNISKSKFVMNEQAIKEASPAFSTVSRDFMDAMSTFDHSKLSRALKSLETNISKTKDPKEIEHLGKMSGVLTGLVDKTTGQSTLARRNESVIREKDEEEKKPEEKPKEKPGGVELKQQKDAGAKPEKLAKVPGADKLEPKPKEEPKDTPVSALKGAEETPEEAPPEAEEPPTEKEKAPGFKILKQRLTSQTITNASLELNENGGTLNLELAGIKIPARLEWTWSGRVIFYVSNTPYVVQAG